MLTIQMREFLDTDVLSTTMLIIPSRRIITDPNSTLSCPQVQYSSCSFPIRSSRAFQLTLG